VNGEEVEVEVEKKVKVKAEVKNEEDEFPGLQEAGWKGGC
jgi:hypothetical protein